MPRLILLSIMGVFAAALAVAAQTSAPTGPPGTVVQSLGAYLAGDTEHTLYRVITSRAPVAKGGQYQWYLTVLAQLDKNTTRLLYQSPSQDDEYALIPKLIQGRGTQLYFPRESITIAGKGQLMGDLREQVVIVLHAAEADCGMSTMSVLISDIGSGPLQVPIQVSNLCSLSAKVVHHTIVLSGPYYNKTAPAYKPTKNKATATLRFVDGRWVERPEYFHLIVPHHVYAPVTPLTHASPMFTPIFKQIITTPRPSGPPQPPKGER